MHWFLVHSGGLNSGSYSMLICSYMPKVPRHYLNGSLVCVSSSLWSLFYTYVIVELVDWLLWFLCRYNVCQKIRLFYYLFLTTFCILYSPVFVHQFCLRDLPHINILLTDALTDLWFVEVLMIWDKNARFLIGHARKTVAIVKRHQLIDC